MYTIGIPPRTVTSPQELVLTLVMYDVRVCGISPVLTIVRAEPCVCRRPYPRIDTVTMSTELLGLCTRLWCRNAATVQVNSDVHTDPNTHTL